jgi:hypothetical protein
MASKSNIVDITVAEADDATAWMDVPSGMVSITVVGTGTFDIDLETRFEGGSAMPVSDASGAIQYSDASISTLMEFGGDPGQEIRLKCSAYSSGTPYLRLGYGV